MIKRITNEINYASAEEPPESEEIIKKRKDSISGTAAAWQGNDAASELRRTDFDPIV